MGIGKEHALLGNSVYMGRINKFTERVRSGQSLIAGGITAIVIGKGKKNIGTAGFHREPLHNGMIIILKAE
jgi:hypothetical protein